MMRALNDKKTMATACVVPKLPSQSDSEEVLVGVATGPGWNSVAGSATMMPVVDVWMNTD